MGKWVTVSEACDILKLRERTLRYRIAKNTIQSKLENNKRFVYIEENDETLHETSNSLHANFEEGLIAHKEIMKEKIQKHLGWLVVWGAAFGGLIGVMVGLSDSIS